MKPTDPEWVKTKEEMKLFFSGVAIGCLSMMCLVILPFSVPKSELTDLKQQAVERGYAEWRLTHAHDGTTEFRWLDKPKDSKPADH